MYRIEKVTDKQGNEKTDGIYFALRKGCVVNVPYLYKNAEMMLEYIKDNQGNDMTGSLRTSIVKEYENDEDCTVVYTMNSVYYLKDINL